LQFFQESRHHSLVHDEHQYAGGKYCEMTVMPMDTTSALKGLIFLAALLKNQLTVAAPGVFFCNM